MCVCDSHIFSFALFLFFHYGLLAFVFAYLVCFFFFNEKKKEGMELGG